MRRASARCLPSRAQSASDARRRKSLDAQPHAKTKQTARCAPGPAHRPAGWLHKRAAPRRQHVPDCGAQAKKGQRARCARGPAAQQMRRRGGSRAGSSARAGTQCSGSTSFRHETQTCCARTCGVADAVGRRRQQRTRREPAAWLHKFSARGEQAPAAKSSAREASEHAKNKHHAVRARACGVANTALRWRARGGRSTRAGSQRQGCRSRRHEAPRREPTARGEHWKKGHHATCSRACSVADAGRGRRRARLQQPGSARAAKPCATRRAGAGRAAREPSTREKDTTRRALEPAAWHMQREGSEKAARRQRGAERQQRAAQEPAAWLQKLAAQGAQVLTLHLPAGARLASCGCTPALGSGSWGWLSPTAATH